MSSSYRASHWDSAYKSRSATGVSWFQPEASVSLRLIGSLGIGSDQPIVDIGGGASMLVDGLLDRGYTDVTVLDVSQAALDSARDRLGDRADKVHWLREDLLDWEPTRRYSVWHDRAVFHFLVDDVDRERYRGALRTGLAPDGFIVMATFAENGPEQCSGLPVARYTASDLAEEIESRLVATEREEHMTPAGGIQPFTWVVAR